MEANVKIRRAWMPAMLADFDKRVKELLQLNDQYVA
jgi:hypothetical protein